jgi:LCP family protein required for cell wall assembly
MAPSDEEHGSGEEHTPEERPAGEETEDFEAGAEQGAGDGLTEDFESEFGDGFGADVEDELVADEDEKVESADRSPADPLEVLTQETVEADVVALADEEEARERAEREAAEREAAESADEGEETEAAPGDEALAAAVASAEGGPPTEEEGAPPEEAEPAPAPEPETEEPPKVGLWARFLAASLVIVISMATATSVSILLYLSDIAKGLGGIPNVQDQLEAVEGGDPQNILILGSDVRPEIEEKGRSDTTMLLRLDPDNDAIALLSLPRDLQVNIPGYGVGKLNDAYFAGGPEKTLTVVKQLTGLKIHHVVNVDFKGFSQAINAIDCVYVDVDRRYFNSNEGLAADQLYAEIDVQAGYQMLCGERALQYVRYRHTDNDLVRAARQQDFLREARQKIGPSRLFKDREELIDIFKEYTTSDIDDPETMLQVLKTFIGAADAPVKQIHFKGTLGRSYVTASNEQIQKAVEQFLGIQDTPGSLGEEKSVDGSGGKPDENKKPQPEEGGGPALIDSTGAGVAWAEKFAPAVKFPVFYPANLVPGSTITSESREYKIADTDKKIHRAYKLVISIPGTSVPLEYYGVMGTTWTDPPILDNPSETREIGGREYDLFYDGDRLRMVAWRTDKAAYWLNNTLLQTLEEDQMLAIADSMQELSAKR